MGERIEFLISESGRRRTPAEIPTVFPELILIDSLPDEELTGDWHEIYLSLYGEADKSRKEGDHKEALVFYRKAQAIVNKVKEKGITDDLILAREASLNYSIIQCYSNFQMDPHFVMREFHNFGEVLFDYFLLIFGNDDSVSEVLQEIQQGYEKYHYINVRYLFKILNDYFYANKDNLKPEKLELIWKCAYFLTRFTGSIHDFFLRSTDLIEEGRKYHEKCNSAVNIAIDAMNLLPEGYIPEEEISENDPDKYRKRALQTFKDQTVNWLDVYSDFLEMEIEHILGNDAPDQALDPKETAKIRLRKEKTQLLKERSQKILEAHRNREKVLPANVEFALEIKAQITFDDLVKNRISYEEAKDIFSEIIVESYGNDFKRIETITQIFLARAAIRYNRIEDANTACDMLRILRRKKEAYNEGVNHVFDKWLNTIKAEIKLLEISSKSEIDEEKQEVRDSVNKITDENISGLSESVTLHDLEEIETIFNAYKLDSDTKRPKLSNKALDAKNYYILGKAVFFKIQLLGEEYKRAKDDPDGSGGPGFKKGPELLKAFMDCQKYLCEAYTHLKNMGYQGSRLFKLIQQKYQEMIDFNDDLLNDFKQKTPDASKQQEDEPKEFDMSEVASDYKIEKWTDMVYKLLRNQDLSQAENYEVVLSKAIGDSLKEAVPTISRTFIVEDIDGFVKISGFVGDGEAEFIKQSIKDYKNGRPRTYLYYTENGKVLQVVPIDKEKEKYMVLEIDLIFSKNTKELIDEVVKGVRYLLKIKELKAHLDKFEADDDNYKEKRLEVLQETKELFKYLFRRHAPTEGHSREMGEMCRTIANELNERLNLNIDLDIAEYAGILHDFGKLFLNLKMLLDIPRRYQNFEREEAEKHAIESVEILRGLLGFKHFKLLIALVASHHVKYGTKGGYPVFAPGDEIKSLLQKLIPKLEKVTDEEKAELSELLSDDYMRMARMMNPVDQVQAVRSTDRKYRPQGPMPLKDLNGYLNRQAGEDFHPEAVLLLINMFKQGILEDNITYTDEEREQLQNFDVPRRIYSSEEIFEFITDNQDELEEAFGIIFNGYLKELRQGAKYNLQLTEEKVGRQICQIYIENENGDREAGLARSDEKGEEFFMRLWEHLGTNEVAPN